MEGKKKYFALIIFLFLGLMIFTFANPAEEEKEFKGGDKDQSETVTNKREDTTEEDTNDTEQEQQDQNQQQNIVTNNNQGNAQGNQGNDAGQTEEDPVDTTLRDALAAVEKAEGTYSQEDVDAAKELLNNVTDTTEKGNLEERLEEVEAGIAVLALLENLEVQVKEADKKADMTDATSYRDTNEIANKIESLNNETVKEELSKRLGEVSKLLDDNAAPTTKVEAKVYGDNVEITAEDEAGNPFQVFLTKDEENEEEISSGYKTASDGVYTLRLVDNAFNEQTIKFTVDTTEPALKDLTNGAHYKEITLNTEDKTKVTIQVTNKDKNEVASVEEGAKLTEDATYEVLLTDEAGNTATYWLAIDSTNPTIENVEDGSSINTATTALIKDKFLTNVVINYVALDKTETKEEFTRADFDVKANNENFSYEYTLDKEGTYTIVATDKIGNTTSKTVIVDMTAAKKNAVNINVKGYQNSVNEQYATNGNKVSAYISINEELKHNPTFTFYANGKKIKKITDEVVKSNSTNEKYPYIYTATLEINEELLAEDGLITFTVSNIYDQAGNKTDDITKITTKKVITLDRTAAARVYSTIRSTQHGEVAENGKDIDYYHTKGTKFEYAISFNELLKEVPTVTIAGRNVEMKLNENVLKNENKFLYEGTFQIPDDEAELTEGVLEIKVTNVKDLVGNETKLADQTKTSNGRRVIYDVTPAKRMSGNIYVIGVKAIENKYYTQYEKEVTANITTNEKLLANPTFTFHNNGKDFDADKVIYRGLNDKGYHLYQASYKLSTESGMKDGEITFTVSNIKDLAGNITADITGPSNSNKVFLDNELNYDKLAIRGAAGEWVTNQQTKEKEYKQYANTNTWVYVDGHFYEKLATNPVVTLNDKVTITSYATAETVDTKGKKVYVYSFAYQLKQDDGLVDGPIQVKMTNCKDAAGNSVELTNEHLTLESQSEVIVDRTAPTYSIYKKQIRPVQNITSFEQDGVIYTTDETEVIFNDKYRLKKITINGNGSNTTAGVIGQVKYITTAGKYVYEAIDAVGNKTSVTIVKVDNELDYLQYVDSIKLTKDATLDKEITIAAGQTKVIDLNGKTLKLTKTSGKVFTNNGTLTIKNGTVEQEQLAARGIITNYGELVIENVKIKDASNVGGSTIGCDTGSKLTVKDTEITLTGEGSVAGIYSNGTTEITNTKVTSSQKLAYAIVVNGDATLENVTAIGYHGGLSVNGGKALVKSGTYEATGDAYGIWVTNNSTTNVVIEDGTIKSANAQGLYTAVDDGRQDAGTVGITINGGNFSGKTGALKASFGNSQYSPWDIQIKGGTFKDTDVSTYVISGYRQNASWTVTEATKIDSVSYLKEIATVGGTYTLESDLTLADEIIAIPTGVNLTINTNGKTISGTYNEAKATSIFKVATGASLKLTGNGTITYTATKPDMVNYSYSSSTIVNLGNLEIDGPTLINTTAKGAPYVIDNGAGAVFTLTSGTIKQTGGNRAIRFYSFDGGSAINATLNGGTVTGSMALYIHLISSTQSVAPIVNLTVNNGTYSSTDTDGFAFYSNSVGNSMENINVTFNGGTFNGYVAFGGGKNKTHKEKVTVNGGTFNNGIGRYVPTTENPEGWIDITIPQP